MSKFIPGVGLAYFRTNVCISYSHCIFPDDKKMIGKLLFMVDILALLAFPQCYRVSPHVYEHFLYCECLYSLKRKYSLN